MESRKERHQHEIQAAEALDAAQNKASYDPNNPFNDVYGNGPRRKKRGPVKRVIAMLALLLILLGVVFAGKALFTDKYAALDPKDTTFVTVKIPEGATALQMGQTLQDKKVITNGKVFYKYAMSQGAEKLQAGTYRLSPAQPMQLIFDQMAAGPSSAPILPKGYGYVSVGQTPDEVAVNLADQVKSVSVQDILTAFNDKQLINKMYQKYPDLLRGVKTSSTKDAKLLDYVYPQAFDLRKAKTADDIIGVLLETSNKTMTPYYKTLRANGMATPNVMALIATSGKAEFERRLAFINKIAPYAQQLAKQYGILASISIAQAAHESNWDNSELSSKYNNFYGVKTQDTTPGKSVVLETTEYVDGKPQTEKARFAVYDSWKDSMKEHAETIVNGNTWNPDQFKDVLAAKKL